MNQVLTGNTCISYTPHPTPYFENNSLTLKEIAGRCKKSNVETAAKVN